MQPRITYFTSFKIALHYLTPKFLLTNFAGWFADREWGAFTHLVIKIFTKVYKIDMSEAQKTEAKDYKSFNQFFIRELKTGARPIAAQSDGIVSPADGRISQYGNIKHDTLVQAKGHLFTLTELLAGKQELAAKFEDGYFITTYLSPRDYHRVHIPCDAVLRKMVYVPGELFSVSPYVVENVPSLFARNERVICYFETKFGPMVQILVGATITGSMVTTWHGVVNKLRTDDIKVYDYGLNNAEAEIKFVKGQEMGAFQLGSTVINLFAKDAIVFSEDLNNTMPIKMGELIGRVK